MDSGRRTRLLEQLAFQARSMREAQREYFKARRAGRDAPQALDDSRRLERALDETLRELDEAAAGPVAKQMELL